MSGKLLDLLKESRPKISRVAVLSDKTGTVNQLKTLQNAALSAGVQLQVAQVQNVNDFPSAFEAMLKSQAESFVILAAPLFTKLAALATKHRMPGIYYNRRFAEAGGLMAYRPDESDPSLGLPTRRGAR